GRGDGDDGRWVHVWDDERVADAGTRGRGEWGTERTAGDADGGERGWRGSDATTRATAVTLPPLFAVRAHPDVVVNLHPSRTGERVFFTITLPCGKRNDDALAC